MNALADKLMELCNGNTEAADFISQIWTFFIVWDDAVDGDKRKPVDTINSAMLWALFGLHDSKFYREHVATLRPAIMQAISSWLVANKFEKSGDESKVEQAYFMRCAPYELFSTVVLLAGGFQQQLKAVEFFRSMAPEDTLFKYKLEHQNGLAEHA